MINISVIEWNRILFRKRTLQLHFSSIKAPLQGPTCVKEDFIKHRSLSALLRNKLTYRFRNNSQSTVMLLQPCFEPPLLSRPSRCILVARQMSLNARSGLPFQKLNVSSSIVSISSQPGQLFSGLSLFNLRDRNMRLTFDLCCRQDQQMLRDETVKKPDWSIVDRYLLYLSIRTRSHWSTF